MRLLKPAFEDMDQTSDLRESRDSSALSNNGREVFYSLAFDSFPLEGVLTMSSSLSARATHLKLSELMPSLCKS